MRLKFIPLLLPALTLFILLPEIVSGQDNYANIYRYKGSNGLSQNTVNHISQDREGFLWIATQDGLNKFDGYNFEILRHNPKTQNTLPGNYINIVCHGNNDDFWIATLNGLCKYNMKTGKYINYTDKNGIKNSPQNSIVSYIFKDSQNVVWFVTKYGISKFDEKTNNFTFYRRDYYEFTYATGYNNFKIIETENRYLWIATKDGIARFDKQTEQYAYYYPEGKYKHALNESFDILHDEKNFFYVVATNGLYKFNSKEKLFTLIPYPNNPAKDNEKNKANIKVIFKDNTGLLWVGTEKGLAYYDKYNNKIVTYSPTDADNNLINFGRIAGIFQDATNILWIGSENGLFKIDRKEKRFNIIRPGHVAENLQGNNRVYAIYVDEKKQIWIGTRGYGILVIDPKTLKYKSYNPQNSKLEDKEIHCITKLSNGRLCVGTTNGAFFYNPETDNYTEFLKSFGLPKNDRFIQNRVSQILLDSGGKYWFATDNGVFYFDGTYIKSITDKNNRLKQGEYQSFNIIERSNGDIWASSTAGLIRIHKSGDIILYTKENSGISNNSVLSVFESSDKTLWCGTETGLNKYLALKDSFVYYFTESHHFNNDYIYAILEDNNNDLWLSSNNGLILFSPDDEKVHNYFTEDGLQNDEFNIRAAYKHSDGTLYFGGVNGLNYFNPLKTMQYTKPPKPIITRFEKITSDGNKSVRFLVGDTIKLNSDERSFTIRFTLPDYTHPYRNSYQYRIKELDSTWATGTNNFVSYNKLSPGKYTFQVLGSNCEGFQNKTTADLYIEIDVPFYMSIFGYITYAMLLVLFVVIIFRLYSKKMRKEKRIFIEKQEASTKALKQGEELAVKTKNIEDSMHYAKRIIDAMLPSDKMFRRTFPQSFILFMPKEIVSGDFFWLDIKDDLIFVAVADCTGHGVPGAFMSIVGLDLLRDILSLGIETPAEILNRLNNEVTKIFRNREEPGTKVKDGMDISICAIDKKNKLLHFAGAMNPLYLLRDNEIKELKADRFYVGPQGDDVFRKFTNHTVQLEDNDVIYMFSDGFADQFGGSDQKKFKIRRFRHLLLNIWNYDFEYQKLTLLETFHNWRNEIEQVDDVIVLGIKPLAK